MLIPFRTDRPRIRFPYLTVTLIVICTLVQILSRLSGTVELQVPVDGEMVRVTEPRLVVELGLWGSKPTWEGLLAHMFVHADELHLFGNMLFLWVFGSLIEDAFRPWGLGLLYLGGGVCAVIAHLVMSAALGNPADGPLVGASGAVAAIMGLFMLRFHRTRVHALLFLCIPLGVFWVRSFWALLTWLLLEVLSGLIGGGNVAHWAHVGGFVAGAVAAPFVGGIRGARQEYFSDDPVSNVEYVRRNEQVEAVRKELRADPTNAYALRRLAQAYAHAGEYQEATQTYLQALSRFSALNLMTQAAETYREMMEHDSAAELPPDVTARLGQYYESSYPAHAAELYRALVLQHPTRPEAEYALLRLATLHHHSLGQPYEAVRCLQEFLQRYPRSQWAPHAAQARAALMQHLGMV